MVVQTARNADQLTVSSFSNSVDRANGGPDRLKNLGIHAAAKRQPGG